MHVLIRRLQYDMTDSGGFQAVKVAEADYEGLHGSAGRPVRVNVTFRNNKDAFVTSIGSYQR